VVDFPLVPAHADAQGGSVEKFGEKFFARVVTAAPMRRAAARRDGLLDSGWVTRI